MSLVDDYKPTMSFEDRDRAREIFDAAVAEMPRDNPSLLVFHGYGGVGKTALRRDLAERLARSARFHRGQIEFNDQDAFMVPEDVLARLRHSFSGDIAFTAFDIGYVYYRRQQYPERPVAELEGLLPENSLIRKIINEVPFGDAGWSIVERLIAWGRNEIATRARESLRRLHDENTGKSRGTAEILQILPQMLAEDLVAHMQDHADDRVLLLIDEYERLWPGEPGGSRQNAIDDILQLMAGRLDGGLIVFFSRYPLHWGEKRRWRKVLKGRQHALNGIPPDAADAILRKEAVPVTEPDIRAAIVKSATVEDGTVYPFFLELQVKDYAELKAYGEELTAHHFATASQTTGERRRELVYRLLRGYGQDLETSLTHVAAARWFDLDLFEATDREFNLGGQPTFDRIRSLSFVESDAENRLRFTPSVWREALVEGLDDERRSRMLKVVFDHMDARAKPSSPAEITEDNCAALAHAAYALAESDPDRFAVWQEERLAPFYAAAREDVLVPVLRICMRLAEAREPYGIRNHALPKFQLASALKSLERPEAVVLLTEVFQELKGAEVGTPEASLAASALAQLASIHLRRDEIAEAAEKLQRADNLAFENDRPLIHLLDAAGIRRQQSSLALQQGQLETARQRAQEAFQFCLSTTKHYDGWSMAALSDLALVLRELGRLNEAEALLARCARWYYSNHSADHAFTRIALSNLAETLRLQGRFADALVTINEALRDHRHIPYLAAANSVAARMRLLHGKILRDCGRHDEAEAAYRTELEAALEIFEEGSRPRALAEADMATLLARKGRFREADAAYRRALHRLEQQPEVGQDDIGRIKNRFGEVLTNERRFEEARRQLDEAETALAAVFGPDHYRVARCLENQARLADAEERQDDAKVLRRRIAEIYLASGFEVRLKDRDWEPVAGDEALALLDRLRYLSSLPATAGNPLLERARLDDLYGEGASMIRVSYRETDPIAKQFAVFADNCFQRLDGHGTAYHTFNAAHPPRLTDESVIKYLEIFCEGLTGDAGEKFHLVEKPDEIIWRSEASDEGREETARHLSPLRIVNRSGSDREARWWIEGMVVFKDRLFQALFEVNGAGMVRMVQDEIRAADLPVATFMRAPSATDDPEQSHGDQT